MNTLLAALPTWAVVTAILIAVIAVVVIILILVLGKKKVKSEDAGETAAATDKKSVGKEKPVKQEKPVKKEKPINEEPKKQPVKQEKPVSAKAAAPAKEEPKKSASATKVYHISKRKEDGMWQIKAAGGEKAIKLFKTQKEAIDYCKKLAENQEANIMIHKEDGSFRKLTY